MKRFFLTVAWLSCGVAGQQCNSAHVTEEESLPKSGKRKSLLQTHVSVAEDTVIPEADEYLRESYCPSAPMTTDPRDCKEQLQKVDGQLLYLRTDVGNFQSSSSTKGFGGSWVSSMDFMQVHPKYASLPLAFNEFNILVRKSGSQWEVVENRDGWNLAHSKYDWTSFFATKDGHKNPCGEYGNKFWGNKPWDLYRTLGCSGSYDHCQSIAGHGWLLFPLRAFTFQAGKTTSNVMQTYNCQGFECHHHDYRKRCNKPILTKSYMYRPWVGFRNAIVVEHFAGDCNGAPVAGNCAMERFYFTKEFGLTMWEAFDSDLKKPHYPSGHCHGPDFYYRGLKVHMVRTGCRQWTETYKLSRKYSLKAYYIEDERSRMNLLKNGDAGVIDVDDAKAAPFWNGMVEVVYQNESLEPLKVQREGKVVNNTNRVFRLGKERNKMMWSMNLDSTLTMSKYFAAGKYRFIFDMELIIRSSTHLHVVVKGFCQGNSHPMILLDEDRMIADKFETWQAIHMVGESKTVCQQVQPATYISLTTMDETSTDEKSMEVLVDNIAVYPG